MIMNVCKPAFSHATDGNVESTGKEKGGLDHKAALPRAGQPLMYWVSP